MNKKGLSTRENIICDLTIGDSIEEIVEKYSNDKCVMDEFKTEWHSKYCTDSGEYCVDCWKEKIEEIAEDLEERQVKYPKIYKHFKHDPEGIPNNYMYVTLFESEPKVTEWLMKQESEQIGIMETEHNWYGNSYLINGKYYHSNKLCSEKMVIYKSLYDGHMAWARPVNMFLSKVPEGRESENPTSQIYRFEEVG